MTDFAAVRRILQAKGAMDHQGVTRTPTNRHCRRCGAAVIAALARQGTTIALDPIPLTAAGELTAILSGAGSWIRYRDEIDKRDRWNMARHPDDVDVFQRHICGNALPEYNEKRRKRSFTGKSIKEMYADGPQF